MFIVPRLLALSWRAIEQTLLTLIGWNTSINGQIKFASFWWFWAWCWWSWGRWRRSRFANRINRTYSVHDTVTKHVVGIISIIHIAAICSWVLQVLTRGHGQCLFHVIVIQIWCRGQHECNHPCSVGTSHTGTRNRLVARVGIEPRRSNIFPWSSDFRFHQPGSRRTNRTETSQTVG